MSWKTEEDGNALWKMVDEMKKSEKTDTDDHLEEK